MRYSSSKLDPARRVAMTLLVVAMMLLVTARAGNAASLQPDRWVVGCRHLSSSELSEMSADQLKYWRLGHDDSHSHQWQAADVGNFAVSATATDVITIYVHGNQVSLPAAMNTATGVARILGHDDPAFGGRLVTFTWPSARIAGNELRDVRVKATRSECYGPALAHFISAQPDHVAINVIGHSYGARLVAVALDELADKHPARSGPIRAVLLGGAMSNSWLLPGHRCGAAMSCVESMIVTTNPADGVLHWYPLLWGLRNRGPEALGDTGLMCRSRLGEDLSRYRQINVSCAIGKSHDWQDYLAASRVRSAIRALMSPPLPPSEDGARHVDDDNSVVHTLPTPSTSPATP